MRGLRRSVLVPLLALPLVVPTSGVIGLHAAGPLAVLPVSAPEPVDSQGNPVGVDGSLPITVVPSELLADPAGPDAPAGAAGSSAIPPSGPLGIAAAAFDAYVQAASRAPAGCHLQWSLLASIGRIESNHAHGGQVDAAGTTLSPILGPVLNGTGFAAIADTDGGRYDGDSRWDRAVGPMQFIPSTWRSYAVDGNGDGRVDPSNIYDATAAAARYLCAGGQDTSDPRQRAEAVFRYNHSDSYVATVLLWADAYARSALPVGPTGTPASPEAPLALPAPGAIQLPVPVPPVATTAVPVTTNPSTTIPTSTATSIPTGTEPRPTSTPPPGSTTPQPAPSTTPPPVTTPPVTTTAPATTATTEPGEEPATVQNDPVTAAATS
ncbi:lytic transglycosylase domain-containing protein [Amycolatopsis sulphurea]